MSASPTNRRVKESMLLALLAIAAVWLLRYPIEHRTLFLSEAITLLGLVAVAWFAAYKNVQRTYVTAIASLIVAVPVLFSFGSRWTNTPVALELIILSTLGALCLGSATTAQRPRHRSLAVVMSGFLILFSTSIADHQYAVALAIAWIVVCVWYLVANHWERLELCMPDDVRRDRTVRPFTVALAGIVGTVAVMAVAGRVPSSNPFSWGISPVSGGSKWSDPGARSGVGTGDQAIAALNHAESFGAVESEIFLESTQPSLYDMFNDTLGKPMTKNKSEMRQAINSNVIEAHERMSKSERGDGSFSTARTGPREHHHFKDANTLDVLQWIGPTGERLALERYNAFDGVTWTKSDEDAAAQNHLSTLDRAEIGDRVWFFDPNAAAYIRGLFAGDDIDDSLHTTAVKVMRLDSNRLPSPPQTIGVAIKDIDRSDFFGIEPDACYSMPGRDVVPPLTVARFASTPSSEAELLMPGALRLGEPDSQHAESMTEGQELAAKLATEWTSGLNAPYDQLESIVDHLRSDFTFDRQVASDDSDPLATFLKTRRGGDHLFATTAAVMLRSLGFQSRLVTGFYASPERYDSAQGQTSILPEDVHAWIEVATSRGDWITIEATPGYAPSKFAPSWSRRAMAWIVASAPKAFGVFGLATVIYLSRKFWIDGLLSLIWWIAALLRTSTQIRVVLWIVEVRARIAGIPRSAGQPQRDWLLGLVSSSHELTRIVTQFCNTADQIVFGNQTSPSSAQHDAAAVVQGLTTRTLCALGVAPSQKSNP